MLLSLNQINHLKTNQSLFMKALKLLILSLLFVAGQQAFGQNILVNNNSMSNMNITFNFAAPCPSVATGTAGMSSSINPYSPGCPLLSITINFIDNTCLPPAPVNVTVPVTGLPFMYSYTKCDGTIVNFHLHFNGIDYILDIPC